MDSVNKYGSDGVPFSGCAEIMPPEQQIQQIKDALVPIVQSLIDAIVPVLEPLFDAVTRLCDEIMQTYPNKRVVWLAYHHPKARVRKKHRARIAKYIAKAVKSDDHD